MHIFELFVSDEADAVEQITFVLSSWDQAVLSTKPFPIFFLFWNAATAFTVTTVFCHTAAWYHGKLNQYYYLECTWRWSSVPDMPRTSLSSNKPLVQSCLNDIKAYFLSIYMTARGDAYACLYMWRSEWVYLCWPCRYASCCTFVMNNAKAQWWS